MGPFKSKVGYSPSASTGVNRKEARKAGKIQPILLATDTMINSLNGKLYRYDAKSKSCVKVGQGQLYIIEDGQGTGLLTLFQEVTGRILLNTRISSSTAFCEHQSKRNIAVFDCMNYSRNQPEPGIFLCVFDNHFDVSEKLNMTMTRYNYSRIKFKLTSIANYFFSFLIVRVILIING